MGPHLYENYHLSISVEKIKFIRLEIAIHHCSPFWIIKILMLGFQIQALRAKEQSDS